MSTTLELNPVKFRLKFRDEIQADFQAEIQAEIQIQPILIILRLSRASPSNFAVSLPHSSLTL
jgi:hypothetical protein